MGTTSRSLHPTLLSVRPDRILVAADGVTLRYLEFDNGWAVEPLEVLVPPPAPGLEPVAYWWGDEDEGPIPVVAYRQPDGRVGLHSMEWSLGEFDPEPGLLSTTALSTEYVYLRRRD